MGTYESSCILLEFYTVTNYWFLYKYLIINSCLTDDLDIQKQTRSFYARANMLKSRFSAASLHTKCMLFNGYCTPMYGCQLWNIAYHYNYDRLRVAFNDAFRLLLDVPRWTSASSLFVLHRVPTFAAVIRKLTYSLYDCIRNSSNSLLIAHGIWLVLPVKTTL